MNHTFEYKVILRPCKYCDYEKLERRTFLLFQYIIIIMNILTRKKNMDHLSRIMYERLLKNCLQKSLQWGRGLDLLRFTS